MSSSILHLQLAVPEVAGLALRDVSLQGSGPSSSRPRVLSSISAVAPSGEVLLILGSSNSGKTTVLDAISCVESAHINGSVYFNDLPASSVELRHHVKYVPHFTHLFPSLSVEETVQLAASFHCASPITQQARVVDALDAMNLTVVRSVRCGNDLSPGQLKRTAIAIELVARPAVLLLDEPTDGLDCHEAYELLNLLHVLANRDRMAVICAMQRPCRRIMGLCQRLLLLADGTVAFSGRVSEAIPHFQGLGRILPPQTNVAEWLVHETSTGLHSDSTHVTSLLDAWPTSNCAASLFRELDDLMGVAGTESSIADDSDIEEARPSLKEKLIDREETQNFTRPVMIQASLLARRNFKDAFRNPAVILLRLMMYLTFTFAIGISWADLPLTADNIRFRGQGLGHILSFFASMSIGSLPAYLSEKPIVIRERSNGSYSALAYVIAHFLRDVVVSFLLSFHISLVLYAMIGLRRPSSNFFFFFLTMAITLLCSESLMLVVSTIVPFLLSAIAVSGFIFAAFMVVMGGLLELPNIPWVLRWIQYISFLTFSLSAAVWNEFDGVTFTKAPNDLPPILEDVAGVDVGLRSGWAVNNKWANLAVIFSMTILYRVLAVGLIHFKWTAKKVS